MSNQSFDEIGAGGSPAAGHQLVASFPTYVDAQALVDRMSDDGFPVEHVRIIGDGVRTVEQVTGRMTKGRAALAGAATGAWFGLLIGLLFGLFTVGPEWVEILLLSLLFGVLWGAIFGFLAHWARGGERDFSSVQTLQAQRYDVYVASAEAERAARYAPGADGARRSRGNTSLPRLVADTLLKGGTSSARRAQA